MACCLLKHGDKLMHQESVHVPRAEITCRLKENAVSSAVKSVQRLV